MGSPSGDVGGDGSQPAAGAGLSSSGALATTGAPGAVRVGAVGLLMAAAGAALLLQSRRLPVRVPAHRA